MLKCLQNIVALKKPMPEVYAQFTPEVYQDYVGKFVQLQLL